MSKRNIILIVVLAVVVVGAVVVFATGGFGGSFKGSLYGAQTSVVKQGNGWIKILELQYIKNAEYKIINGSLENLISNLKNGKDLKIVRELDKKIANKKLSSNYLVLNFCDRVQVYSEDDRTPPTHRDAIDCFSDSMNGYDKTEAPNSPSSALYFEKLGLHFSVYSSFQKELEFWVDNTAMSDKFYIGTYDSKILTDSIDRPDKVTYYVKD
ncbi:hypothetical protein HZA39_01125 [Candidatus Peregrinibacteria bacterium]|nr:hypothetical protein [Candidatus Peregrinibacteria bacterium]